MSAIQMICERCGRAFFGGMVGSTPWPPHKCPDGTTGAPTRMCSTEEFEQAPNVGKLK